MASLRIVRLQTEFLIHLGKAKDKAKGIKIVNEILNKYASWEAYLEEHDLLTPWGHFKKRDSRREHTRSKILFCVCKKKMYVRQGAHGSFWGCGGFPECRHTEQIERPAGIFDKDSVMSRTEAACLFVQTCDNDIELAIRTLKSLREMM